MQMAVEGSVNLPVVVNILLEDFPQEHQLSLQALIITKDLWLCVSEWIVLLVYWMVDDGTWCRGRD
jgi:hypothetical protein